MDLQAAFDTVVWCMFLFVSAQYWLLPDGVCSSRDGGKAVDELHTTYGEMGGILQWQTWHGEFELDWCGQITDAVING